jgi:hypothetical protein
VGDTHTNCGDEIALGEVGQFVSLIGSLLELDFDFDGRKREVGIF